MFCLCYSLGNLFCIFSFVPTFVPCPFALDGVSFPLLSRLSAFIPSFSCSFRVLFGIHSRPSSLSRTFRYSILEYYRFTDRYSQTVLISTDSTLTVWNSQSATRGNCSHISEVGAQNLFYAFRNCRFGRIVTT